jgi:activator of HSP90 ATPase
MSTWNVNSWHWEEKEYGPHAKSYFEKIFTNLPVISEVVDDISALVLTKVTKFEGDVYTNIRKGKRIVGYDFKIEVSWKADVNNGSFTGKVFIPEVSTEVDNGEYEFQILSDANASSVGDDAIKAVKEVLKKQGKALVFEKLNEYLNALKSGPPPSA